MEEFVLHNLRVEGIPVLSIRDIVIENSPNSHAHMYLKAEIDEKDEDKLLYEVKSCQTVALYGGSHTIFKGVLDEINFEKKDQVRYAGVVVKSYSKIMDVKKKCRSFQTLSATYETLIGQVLGNYEGASYYMAFQDKPIGKLIIQYHETDWEFLRRILSEIFVPMGNVEDEDHIKIYFGIPNTDSNLEIGTLKLSKNINDFKVAKNHGIKITESDFLDFTFKADCKLDIFSGISCNQNNVAVHNIRGKLKKGILEFEYDARKKEGIVILPEYCAALVGVSLEGRILEVKGKLVRVHLKIDDGYPSADEYWFPYSTLSSSKDGSGWYYMPEPGNAIRVNFPTKYTNEAIAINSISGYSAPKKGEDNMKDPSTKFLSNSSGQKMGMGKDGIRISTRSGAAFMNVNNSGDIVIAAGDSITITAEEKITLKSKEIMIEAEKKAELTSKEGAAVLLMEDGSIELNGAEVLIN